MSDRSGNIAAPDKPKPALLVPGGTGFLGRHLVRSLQTKYAITVLTRRPAEEALAILSSSGVSSGSVEVVSYGSRDLELLAAERRFLGVIYCAVSYGRGENRTEVLRTNVELPYELAMLTSRYGAELFLHIDTFFGKHSEQYDYLREYRASKKEAVARLKTLHGTARIVNLIVEHLYGADDAPDKFIPALIQKLSINTPRIDLTPGEQRRDFVHVDDVVSGIEVLLRERTGLAPFSQFEIGTGVSHSIRELAVMMKTLIGSSSELRFGAEPYRPHELMESHADTRTLQALGWQPRVSLEQGLRSIVAARAVR